MDLELPSIVYQVLEHLSPDPYFVLTKGHPYVIVEREIKSDSDNSETLYRIFPLDLKDHTEKTIRETLDDLGRQQLVQTDDEVLPITIEKVIDNHIVIGKSLPNHYPVRLDLPFNVILQST